MQRKNMIERKQNPEQKVRTILRNILITVGIMGAATIVCLALQHFSEADTHVPLLFVLAVVIVARFTEGYVYGILSAMAAVVLVNYVFTYPYFELNFSITGYPLTFVVMLATAVMVSALTTQIKWQEQIRLEVEKEKTRANLLRAVSHDIRTPLTSIQASASGILDNYDALGRQEKVELLEGIRDESRWLIRMVENLLSITRMDDSAIRLTLKPELVSDVVESAIARLGRRGEQHEISMQTQDDLLLANMDAPLIVQVLLNLLENAIKYTPAGSQIVLGAKEEGGLVRISISDNGPGISDENQAHVFDLFFTSAGMRGDARRGLGLGLALCRAIVSAHGGEINVSNNEPHGSIFSFTLQRAEVNLDE